MKTISAGDAKRHFSSLLRDVATRQVVTVLSPGRPVATLSPVRQADDQRQLSRQSLLARLRRQSHRVAAENHCRQLLSEDFSPGFTWRGVTVADPFREPPHLLLAQLLT